MNSNSFQPDRLEPLMLAVLDGEPTDIEVEALRALLIDDSDAQREYARLMTLHAMMQWSQTTLETRVAVVQDAAETVSHSTTTLPRIEVEPASLSRRIKRYDSIHWQRHKIRFNAMTAVLTALAWVGFSYFVWLTTTPDDFRPNPQGEDFNFVAYISGVYEHEWAAEMRAMAPNSSMAAGERLQLAEGIIEITFFDGAVVVLEAPAEFVVNSPGAGTLEKGKLTAEVTPESIGFVVDTPGLTVTDLGTAFGIVVQDDGSVQVSVFTGRVEAEPKRDGQRQPGAGQVVVAGESIVVSTIGVVSREPLADVGQFVRHLPDRRRSVHASILWGIDASAGSSDAPNNDTVTQTLAPNVSGPDGDTYGASAVGMDLNFFDTHPLAVGAGNQYIRHGMSSYTTIVDFSTVYTQFTISANAGFKLSLTDLSFDSARGETPGHRGFEIYGKADGIPTVNDLLLDVDDELGTRDLPTSRCLDLSGVAFQGINFITFRYYPLSTMGSIDFAKMKLHGTVTAIPEPSPLGSSILMCPRSFSVDVAPTEIDCSWGASASSPCMNEPSKPVRWLSTTSCFLEAFPDWSRNASHELVCFTARKEGSCSANATDTRKEQQLK